MAGVIVLSDETTRRLTALSVLIKDATPLLRRGRAVLRRGLQRHFAERNRTPNKLGGRRSNFWRQVRTSTQLGALTARTADVVIGDSRFPQKLFGGPIVAKSARMLAIPVDREAYGLRAGPKGASEFERVTGHTLIFIRQRAGRGNALLATKVEGSDFLRVRYVLTPRVVQRPDPEALPRPGVLDAEVVAASQTFIQGELDKRV